MVLGVGNFKTYPLVLCRTMISADGCQQFKMADNYKMAAKIGKPISHDLLSYI